MTDLVARLIEAEKLTDDPVIEQALLEAATLISQLRSRLSDLEGWKLVPVKPTEEMIRAGLDNNPTAWVEGTDRGFPRDVITDIYPAMISASPSPPIPAVEIDGEKERGS